MADHTVHHSIPYPEGRDAVAVHTDVEALAVSVDAVLHSMNLVLDTVQHGVVPPRVANLFNYDRTVSGTLSPNGGINEHATNRTSEFIPVTPSSVYTSWSELAHRVAFYDRNRNFIAGTDTDYVPEEQVAQWETPANAAYARVGATIYSTFTPAVIFNRGNELWQPGEAVPSGWWEGRELPPNHPVSVGDLTFARDGVIDSEFVDGAVPERIVNLYDRSSEILGNLSPTGAVIDHAENVVSDWIRVKPGAPYVTYHPAGVHRVVFYNANQQAISGTDTGWQTAATITHWNTPPNAEYMRIGIQLAPHTTSEGVIVNHGATLWQPGGENRTGWWDDRELPPGTGSVDESALTELVEKLLPQYEPSIPTLQFETIFEGWEEPYWLSEDGEMLYGRHGYDLIQSADEWETRHDVHTFDQTIQAVRTLQDGELLVSTSRDESAGVKAKLFRSTGYDRDNPTAATWAEVLEIGATQANINNSWGLHVYQNIVLAGEYGLRGEEGARRVWMSEDHGQTFTLVFDQKTVEAAGQPEWGDNAHVHTAAWDPYWSRLWVACGDSPSTATYYSDDKGATWHYVEGSGGPSPAVQYTGIMPLPDVVVFGSDRAPNGVYVYRRGNKTDAPTIEPILLIDDHDAISRVFQMPYKRDWAPTTPTYFAGTPAADRAPSIIVGAVDGKKWHILWEGTDPTSGLPYSGQVRWALGPTAQGNIIAQMTYDPTVTGTRTMKAPAPTWARA